MLVVFLVDHIHLAQVLIWTSKKRCNFNLDVCCVVGSCELHWMGWTKSKLTRLGGKGGGSATLAYSCTELRWTARTRPLLILAVASSSWFNTLQKYQFKFPLAQDNILPIIWFSETQTAMDISIPNFFRNSFVCISTDLSGCGRYWSQSYLKEWRCPATPSRGWA